jgi:hypothetical protein
MAGFRKAKWIGEAPVAEPTMPCTEPETPIVPELEPIAAASEPAVPEPTVTAPEPTVPEPTVPEPTVPEPTVPADPTLFYTYIAAGAAAAAIYAYIIYRCIDSPPLFPKWSWYQHIFPLA